ncbi:MAG: imidazoleglycerol-phosphate dehydratase HisB [Lentisphaeria bacterium]|nr:imidazoleglycerol-phosphate dehydratase HisB [Lentisphaeria bacterium]
MNARIGQSNRQSRETQIDVEINLDGRGIVDISTGLPFMDHMLEGFARHGYFDLRVKAVGDLEIDAHHTMEDTGIVMGQAIRAAVGDREGICRFGYFLLPMDEALARCALDLSGRPHLSYTMCPAEAVAGGMPIRLFREFFQALVNSASLTLHIDQLAGVEAHHCLEAAFKAFGKALDAATRPEPRCQGVPSTKGMLD